MAFGVAVTLLSLDTRTLATRHTGDPPVLKGYLGDALRDAHGQLVAVLHPRRLEELVVPCLDGACRVCSGLHVYPKNVHQPWPLALK